jgi:hypothetical protein
MGKRQPKPPQPPRESLRIDTQELAHDLYKRGLITKHQAYGDMPWYQTERRTA